MIIEIKKNLVGSVLDIGGGGEVVIGQVYGKNVIAIDNCQEELDDAPDCCNKLLMDATKLSYSDDSFDNVTFFYSLMYMTEETQRKAICEASRVLRTGGLIRIWDCEIDSAYPEPFVVDLDICFEQKHIHTSYGIIKDERQDFETVSQILKHAGLHMDRFQRENNQFYIQCRKE